MSRGSSTSAWSPRRRNRCESESITLSSCGGVLGIGCGFAVASLVAYFSPLPYAIKAWSIAVGLGVTFAVGVFFGIYPAMQAARLDPIEALRYE